MSSSKETMDIIIAGKLVDAREKGHLDVARNLFNMGKLTNAEIASASGVPTSTIRRWKRKAVLVK